MVAFTKMFIKISAVQVGFQSAIYVGMESFGVVTVCAVINNGIVLDRSISVELSTVLSGSADGKFFVNGCSNESVVHLLCRGRY